MWRLIKDGKLDGRKEGPSRNSKVLVEAESLRRYMVPWMGTPAGSAVDRACA